MPRYESTRGPGSTADVDYWTSRDPVEVLRSHVNYVVPDTKRWEQSTAYYIDKHNDKPKPFVWTAKASDILEKVKRARAALDNS